MRAYALVDDEDFEHLSQWRWSLHTKGYVERRISPTRRITMHRQLLGLTHGDRRQGEHINRNPLDNRRSNLRLATTALNKQNLGLQKNNTSGYRGVSRSRGRWIASAMLNYRQIHIGVYDTAEQADTAAKAFRAAQMPFSEDARAA